MATEIAKDRDNRDNVDRDQADRDQDTSCVKFRNLFKPLKKWTGLPDCIRKVCSDRDQKGPKKPKIDEQCKLLPESGDLDGDSGDSGNSVDSGDLCESGGQRITCAR